jgi:hypothetical protein
MATKFGCVVGVTEKLGRIAILTTIVKNPSDNEKWLQPLEG